MSLKLRHQRKTADNGGEGRVSSVNPTPWNQFTTVAYLGLVHYCTVFERSGPDLGMSYRGWVASVGFAFALTS